jgi:surface-anchored protein
MALISSNPVVMHHYTAPGVYRVTLTAISTACDGSHEQRGVGALTWHVPG